MSIIKKLEIILEKYNYDYEIKGKNIYIRFQDLEITNGKDNHVIPELFVRLVCGDSWIDIEGARFKYLDIELSNNYRHSHLSGSISGYFSSFCLGSGRIAEYAHGNINSIEDAEMFILLLKSFLGWESLTGGPYKYMKNNKTAGTICPSRYYNMGSKPSIKINDWVEFSIKNNRICISQDWIKRQISPNCYEINGQYYREGSLTSIPIDYYYQEYKDSFSTFIFKGEEQKFEIIKTLKPYTGELVVHPETIKQYDKYIAAKLKTWLLKDYQTRGEIQDGSSKESVDTNDVPVLTDF